MFSKIKHQQGGVQGAGVRLGEVCSWATEGRAPGTQHPVPPVGVGQASALRPAPSTPHPLGTVTMQVVVGVSRQGMAASDSCRQTLERQPGTAKASARARCTG